MIAVFLLALAAVVLLVTGAWQQPQKAITTGVNRAPRIDSNLAQLFDSPAFQRFAFEASDASSYEAARLGLTPTELATFLYDNALDVVPETLRGAIALPEILGHAWQRPLLIDGDCPACETKPWAGIRGELVGVDRNDQLLLDHLRRIQQA